MVSPKAKDEEFIKSTKLHHCKKIKITKRENLLKLATQVLIQKYLK